MSHIPATSDANVAKLAAALKLGEEPGQANYADYSDGYLKRFLKAYKALCLAEVQGPDLCINDILEKVKD